MPKAMTKEDLQTVKNEFVQAAKNAIEAGAYCCSAHCWSLSCTASLDVRSGGVK